MPVPNRFPAALILSVLSVPWLSDIRAQDITIEQPAGSNLIDGVSSIDFGVVDVGSQTTKTFTVRNDGGSSLLASNPGLEGPNFDQFILESPWTPFLILNPGESSTFDVTFSPTASGPFTVTLQLTNNDPDENPFDIQISGIGLIGAPEIEIEQPAGINLSDGSGTVDFGSTAVGTHTVRTFAIRNTGLLQLGGLALTKTGTDAARFSLGALGVTSLDPGASTSFDVTFTPSTAGPFSASIEVASNDADENPFNIAVSGTGLLSAPEIAVEQPPGANLVSESAVIRFEAPATGSPVAKSFSIRNIGSGDLENLSVSFAGGNHAPFNLTQPGATSLSPTESTSFDITFTSPAAGSFTTELRIASNDADEDPFRIVIFGSDNHFDHIVTSAADGTPPSGLTLRQAVAGAQAEDSIGFSPSLAGQTIGLTDGELLVLTHLAIDASPLKGTPTDSPPITISGNDSSRIFYIPYSVPGPSVTLRALELVQGRSNDGLDFMGAPSYEQMNGGAGGAIYNGGNLILRDCLLRNNATGAGGNGGSYYEDDPDDEEFGYTWEIFSGSGLGGSGGAVFSAGKLVVSSCTITNNHTGRGGDAGDANGDGFLGFGDWAGGNGGEGGAICGWSSVLIENSTFSGNSTGAGGNGGSSFYWSELESGRGGDGGPGGAVCGNSDVMLVNSTFTANSTGAGGTGGYSDGMSEPIPGDRGSGGAISADGVSLVHCTITGNTAQVGAGVAGAASLSACIIHGNSGGMDLDASPAGTPGSRSRNLIGTIGNGVTLDHPNVPGNPMLGLLGAHGGPTHTMVPQPGSPAIDAATATIVTPGSDQRGASRLDGPTPDLGAVETTSPATLASTDGDGIPDALEGPGAPYPHLDPGSDDSALDSDGDGTSDGDELAAMTDPLDPNSKLMITGIVSNPTTNLSEISFTTFPGFSYQLEFSEHLDFANPRSSGPLIHAEGATTLRPHLPMIPGGRDFMRVRLIDGAW